jgi:hypothetical protein
MQANGTAPDPTVARLVQQLDQERRKRIRAQRQAHALRMALDRQIAKAAEAKGKAEPTRPDGR